MTAAGRTLGIRVEYANGDQMRKLVTLVTELLAPYSRAAEEQR